MPCSNVHLWSTPCRCRPLVESSASHCERSACIHFRSVPHSEFHDNWRRLASRAATDCWRPLVDVSEAYLFRGFRGFRGFRADRCRPLPGKLASKDGGDVFTRPLFTNLASGETATCVNNSRSCSIGPPTPVIPHFDHFLSVVTQLLVTVGCR